MIEHEQRGAVALLRIARDERRNALDVEHCDALRAALEKSLAAGARAVVLTGAGSAFCAGADLDMVYASPFRAALAGLLSAVAISPVPVLAAVGGPAIGAGTQLAIAADLRVAGSEASFAVPAARLGLAVDRWTVRRLRELVGTGRAGAVLVGMDRFDAVAAHACGLVDRLAEDALAAALAWADELAALAPLSLAYAKAALREPIEADPGPVDASFAACWDSADLMEAREARRDQRPPSFTGS